MSRLCAVGALTLSAVLLTSATANAQTIYLIHDLGPISDDASGVRPFVFWNIGQSTDTLVSMPFRINNKNQVAFYRCSGSGINKEWSAWLWLPEDDTATDVPAGFYNLTALDGAETNGIALDINESTQVAGGRGDDIGNEEAIVWEISWDDIEEEVEVTATLIDFSSTVFEDSSDNRAHGINDDSPPVVVGSARFEQTNCPGDPILNYPFIAELGSAPDDLQAIGSNRSGFALSVNADTLPHSVGFMKSTCSASPSHDADISAIEWEDDDHEAAVVKIDSSYGNDAIKINEAGNIVGWSRDEDPSDSFNSLVKACFWETGASSPDELGNFTAFDDPEETIAYGVNETSPLIVAGTSATQQQAFIWMQDSNGDWIDNDTDLVVNLNNVLLADCSSAWILVEAFDVSDDGWIVGWGIVDGIARGFVLEPDGVTCQADFTSPATPDHICPDGEVDVFELLAVLAYWHEDEEPATLPAGSRPGDITDHQEGDPDGYVNVFDLLMVLANWGPCTDPGQPLGLDEDDCFDLFYPDEMEKLEGCLEAVAEMQQQF